MLENFKIIIYVFKIFQIFNTKMLQIFEVLVFRVLQLVLPKLVKNAFNFGVFVKETISTYIYKIK